MVLVVQNITKGPGKYLMINRLIMGDTLAVCKKDATVLVNETSVIFELAVKKDTTHVFLQPRALWYQLQNMRHYLRKP
jgi:hypothetical protein